MKLIPIPAVALLMLSAAICNADDQIGHAVAPPAAAQIRPSQTISFAASRAPIEGSSTYFTGHVHIQPLFAANAAVPLSGGYVTFEPGARSAWHTHPTGQYLIVTAGAGWTQEWKGPVIEVHEGDVIWCPPGVKHWHGATPSTAMTHMALTGTVDEKNVAWMEKVSDSQYRK